MNYAVLLVRALAGDALYGLHARRLRIERPQCHASAYLMLGLYKLGIWLLIVIPLYIVQNQGAKP